MIGVMGRNFAKSVVISTMENKPIILTHEHMRPGMEVERHLRKYGHLPELGCCEHDQPEDPTCYKLDENKPETCPGNCRIHGISSD